MEEKEETKKPELNEKQKTKLKDKFNIENFINVSCFRYGELFV